MYDGVVDPIEIDRLYNETINNDDRFIEIFNQHAIYNIKWWYVIPSDLCQQRTSPEYDNQ